MADAAALAVAFRRRLDHVIGGWTVAWSIVGFVLIGTGPEHVPTAWTLVGLAAAAATLTDGIQMLVAVRRATSDIPRPRTRETPPS